MSTEMLDRYQPLFTQLRELGSRLLIEVGDDKNLVERAKQKPRVLIVGEFNAGKSSLVNSALGETLLPTGVTPTTSLVTMLDHGPFRVTVKPMGEKDPIKIEPGKARTPGYGIPDGTFDWEGFQKLLTDPKNIDQIEMIQITHPAVPPTLTILDTPGINDIAKSRAEIVYGLVPSADIVVFVISALKPFAESERVFLEEKLLANDLKKIVFVVNRMDEIEAGEREELLADIKANLVKALNTSYERINTRLGQNLFQKIETVEVFPVCGKEMAPLDGKNVNRSIGFELASTSLDAGFAGANRRLWKHVLEMASHQRATQVEAFLHHSLRRATLRIRRAIEEFESGTSSDRESVVKRMQENAGRLQILRDTLRRAETRIRETEESLKANFQDHLRRTMQDLLSLMRLQRDPGTVNTRLKDLYEYITSKMKATLDDLYAELNQSFDAVLDDKRFLEQRKLEIEYDLSDFPGKVVSSLSFAYLAAIFFGINIGLFAGAAYFASQIVSNQRSVKQFFMTATVSEDKLKEVEAELQDKIDHEVEYACDFVRQSLVQRVDLIQNDLKNLVYALTKPQRFNIAKITTDLEEVSRGVNAFLVSQPAKS